MLAVAAKRHTGSNCGGFSMTVFSIRWRRVAATILFAFACGATAFAQERRVYAPPDLSTVRAITAEHGLVVAQERIAAQIGADILRQAAMQLTPRLPPALRWPSPIRAPETSAAAASW
jgi:hypothetical protein